jgi:hypothetical protein
MAKGNDDQNDLILGMLRGISDKQLEMQLSVVELDKKVDLHIQKTEFELSKINELDRIQNELLDQHIEGVNTLKKWCDQHEEQNRFRFEKLEEPRKFVGIAIKVMAAMGTVATAGVAILGLIKLIKG